MMNEGARLGRHRRHGAAPADLARSPYLQPVYDEPEFIVRQRLAARTAAGGTPTRRTSSPLPSEPSRPSWQRWRAGRRCLSDRALALCEAGDDASLRLAGHLAELAWQAAPEDPAVCEVRRLVFTARARTATSTMARGVFTWAARESLGEEA